jgi:RNA polymerase sigma-70 factor (ECF subfamily)
MDSEARFNELFQVAYPRLRRFAANRGLRVSDADDLVAATLEIAWRRLDTVPIDDPMPWLFVVARNLWRNSSRADVRREHVVSRLSREDPAEELLDAAVVEHELMRRAFESLEEDDQELLRLVAWDGLTPAQAAHVLACSPVALRSRLHRARNRLAAVLGFDPRVQRPAASEQLPNENAHESTATEVS